jgi:hypothetical protein
VSAIDVTVHNKANESFKIDTARHGVTNGWCQLPGNPIAPHSTTNFEVGDNLFAATLNVSYVAGNHDSIALQADSGYDDVAPSSARCLVLANGRAPAPYRCSAKHRIETLDRGGLAGTRVLLIDWEIERT